MRAEAAPPAPHAAGPAPAGPAAWTREGLQVWLVDAAASVLGCERERIDVDAPIFELGLDSTHLSGLVAGLSEQLGRELDATFLIRHATIAAAAAALVEEPQTPATAARAGWKPGTQAAPGGAIEVIGMACRFPRAGDLGAYWSNLVHGRDCLRPWSQRSGRGDGTASRAGREDHAGLMDNIDRFDAAHFRIAPAEAAEMDPQQRLLLEVACEALEDAGLGREALRGSETGVFVGASHSEFALERFRARQTVSGLSGTGSALSIIANRLSYVLDLGGPSLTVDTACSSSTVALHLACQSLRSGEIDTAIVAGVNLLLSDAVTGGLRAAGMLSPSSQCRSFDASADGYVRGEGVGVLVLRARRTGDPPPARSYARILATGCNQDGRSGALTAPSPLAQERLLERVRAQAGCRPDEVTFIEAHGSATPLGDPIEVHALMSAYGRDRPADRPLWIGSVKSNIGHLEAAAGIAGLIKAVLAIHHRRLPPSLHCRAPNPHVQWDRLPVRVADSLRTLEDATVIGGVSSFGFGGTNAHVLLASAAATATGARRATAQAAASRGAFVMLGARSADSLQVAARRWADWLDDDGPAPVLDDMAWSSQLRAADRPWRAASWGRSTAELVADLRALGALRPPAREPAPRRIDGGLLILDGELDLHGSLRDRLPWAEPLFRSTMARCREALLAQGGPDLDGPLVAGSQASRLYGFASLWGLGEVLQAHGLRVQGVRARGVGRAAGACLLGLQSMRTTLVELRDASAAGPPGPQAWQRLEPGTTDGDGGNGGRGSETHTATATATAIATSVPVVILSQDPDAAAQVPGHPAVRLVDDGRPLHVALLCQLVAQGLVLDPRAAAVRGGPTWLPPTPWEHAVFAIEAVAATAPTAMQERAAATAARSTEGAQADPALASAGADDAPRTATEQIVAGYFANFNGRSSVPMTTRLIQLIQPRDMTDICRRLGERLQCELGIDVLLRASDLRELAAEIDGRAPLGGGLRDSLQRGAARRRSP